VELRKWQEKFLDKWDVRKAGVPFLCVAVPGSGKTVAALTAAHEWLQRGNDRRIVIVVPTDNLRTQWQHEALSLFGLQLQTTEFGTNFKEGFRGAVTTYSTVDYQAQVFQILCSRCPTLVIFDEVHHCGDKASYGIAINFAFKQASEKLLVSGTPWRTEGTRIPFVQYGEDPNKEDFRCSKADFTYDHQDALADFVVRYLSFSYDSAEIHFDCDGRVEEMNRDITDEEASQRLRKVLQHDGDFVRKQIAQAHAKLLDIRQTIPDAAAMAACCDATHAKLIAATIRDVTGCEPAVIVSDDDIGTHSVEEFRTSSSPWMVSVRQVSEGTDIKRLQVLCYFTNWVTSMFFRQLIGRVSRVRDMDDYEAYVFLPSDPRLIRLAQDIEKTQKQALREQPESTREQSDRPPRQLTEDDLFTTRHIETEVLLIGGKEYPTAIAQRITAIANKTGLAMVHAAKVVEAYPELGAMTQNSNPVAAPQPQSLEATMLTLRKKINRVAFSVAKTKDVEVKVVHGKFPRQDQMSESQLRDKLQTLLRWQSEAT
jgi:superfamily II DNA or RNA helicase